jgi:UDPglucose 6-dehydrogenase
MRLTFFNQIADLCEKAGANFEEVAEGCGLDQRIGDHYLSPGPGYGGSCFPKDTHALALTAKKLGSPLSLVETTIAANDARKAGLTKRIENAVGGSLSGLTVAVLGLAFKAGTDDMRDSVALELIPQLQKHGAKVKAFDPVCNGLAAKIFTGIVFAENASAAVHHADVVVVVTEWPEFAELAPKHLASAMKGKTVVDFRNVFDAKTMSMAGLRYFPLGAPMMEPMSLEAGVNAA